MAKPINNDEQGWGCVGCGTIAFGVLNLLFLRGVSATDAYQFQWSWALMALGVAILVALGFSRGRKR
jgi:hypothetical protein